MKKKEKKKIKLYEGLFIGLSLLLLELVLLLNFVTPNL